MNVKRSECGRMAKDLALVSSKDAKATYMFKSEELATNWKERVD